MFVLRPLSSAEQEILGLAAEITGRITDAKLLLGTERPSLDKLMEIQRAGRIGDEPVRVVLHGQPGAPFLLDSRPGRTSP